MKEDLIPLLNRKDGGPYITTGIVVTKDERGGRNAGVYRLMYRTSRETGIDLVSPSDLRSSTRSPLMRGRLFRWPSPSGFRRMRTS